MSATVTATCSHQSPHLKFRYTRRKHGKGAGFVTWWFECECGLRGPDGITEGQARDLFAHAVAREARKAQKEEAS